MNVSHDIRVAPAGARYLRWAGILFLAFSVTGLAQQPPGWTPAWWASDGVTSGTPDNYAAINAGQLKNMATAAYNELVAHLPGGVGTATTSDGTTLSTLVANWNTHRTTDDQYAAVNLGQLANIAQPFCLLLTNAGYYKTNPFTNPTDNFAVANVGQLKNLFSFDLGYSATGNSVPDWWAIAAGLNPNDPSEFQRLTANPKILVPLASGDTNPDIVPATYAEAYSYGISAANAATDAGADKNGSTKYVIFTFDVPANDIGDPTYSQFDPDVSKVVLKWSSTLLDSSRVQAVEIQWKQGSNAPWEKLAQAPWADGRYPSAGVLQLFSCLNYSFRVIVREKNGLVHESDTYSNYLVPLFRSVQVQRTWSQVSFPGFSSPGSTTKYLSATLTDSDSSSNNFTATYSNPNTTQPQYDYIDSSETVRFIEGTPANGMGSRRIQTATDDEHGYFTVNKYPGGYWAYDFAPNVLLSGVMQWASPNGEPWAGIGDLSAYGDTTDFETSGDKGLTWTYTSPSGPRGDSDWYSDWVNWVVSGFDIDNPLPYGAPLVPPEPYPVSLSGLLKGGSVSNEGSQTWSLSGEYETKSLVALGLTYLPAIPNAYTDLCANAGSFWGTWGGEPTQTYTLSSVAANPGTFIPLSVYEVLYNEMTVECSHGRFVINVFPVGPTQDIPAVAMVDEVFTDMTGGKTHTLITWAPPTGGTTSDSYGVDLPMTVNADNYSATPQGEVDLTLIASPIDVMVVNRDKAAQTVAHGAAWAQANGPIYAGPTSGDMVKFGYSGPFLSGATFNWKAQGPNGVLITGPSGSEVTQWVIADSGGNDPSATWLSWEPGTYTITCTISGANATDQVFTCLQQVGERAKDVVVIGWFDPSVVSLSTSGVDSNVLTFFPATGSPSNADQKTLTYNYLTSLSTGSLTGPAGGASLLTMNDRTYILNWMFKYMANSAPPDSFANESDLDSFEGTPTGYKLFNRLQIKYLVNGTQFQVAPTVLQYRADVGTMLDPVFGAPTACQIGPANGGKTSNPNSGNNTFRGVNDMTFDARTVGIFNTLMGTNHWSDLGSLISEGVSFDQQSPAGTGYGLAVQVFPTFYVYEETSSGTFSKVAVRNASAAPSANFSSAPYPPGSAPFIP